MRACVLSALSLVWAALLTGGCTAPRNEAGASGSPDPGEEPTATATATVTFVESDRFCVPESMTLELPPDRQGPVARPVGACGNYVNDEAMARNTLPCGPCGFVFDPKVTEAARARVPDTCCYEVSSPPPPPPQPGAAPSEAPIEAPARWSCEANKDCVATCFHGAVNREWWTLQSPRDCKDGCTSKGTEAPVCREGRCVARRFGADDPQCTEREL